MKPFRYLALLLSLVLVLNCQLIKQAGKQPAEPASVATATPKQEEGTPTETGPQPTAEPTETQVVTNDNPDPGTWEKPPQSQAAEIRPKEMRTAMTHLSHLMDYQVLDENGNKLGVASDYIVNTCETYLIYILMEPVASLNFEPGSRVVIPFEAVTINSGVLDAENHAIQLRLVPEQFAGAPVFPARQPLTPTDWEGAVRAFWSKRVRIGVLSTSCNVPGGPVYKVAYATELLGVKLYDGQNNLLGEVQEGILEPESGKIGFYIVKPAEGDGLVMVHLQATNIPKEALLPGGTLTLVLLVDPKLFWNAPRLTSIEEADDFALQSTMRQYWDK